MSGLKFFVIGLALIAMAWPSEPPTVRPGLAGSEWRILEIDGTKASGAGTVRFTHTSIRGKGPCNSYSGAFRETAGKIEIAGINNSLMMCAGRMDLERTFLDGLGRARSYRVDDRTLLLIDADGRAVVKLDG